MNLKDYREIRNITAVEAAKELGVTYLRYWRWESGDIMPKIDQMIKIKRWSKGAVTADDFYSQHETE